MSIDYKVVVRNTELRKFLVELFTDDNGISEEAYIALTVMVDTMFGEDKPEWLNSMLHLVEATDGRFYLEDGWEKYADSMEPPNAQD